MAWVRQSINVTSREMGAEPQGIYSAPCDYMAAGNPSSCLEQGEIFYTHPVSFQHKLVSFNGTTMN